MVMFRFQLFLIYELISLEGGGEIAFLKDIEVRVCYMTVIPEY